MTGLPGFWELLGFAIEGADETEAVLRMHAAAHGW